MKKREVVKRALNFEDIPYVPWSCNFTIDAANVLKDHLGCDNIDTAIDNHLLWLVDDAAFFTDIGNCRVKDYFDVVWDRTVDKDIGVVEGLVLPRPTLADYEFPDPQSMLFYKDIDSKIAQNSDSFRIFQVGFSLYERAWSMRGMENLMMDFYDNPDFVRSLFGAIADFNIALIERALDYDIDAVYFGDDWGQQTGLQMGYGMWKEFIYPRLERMYGKVRDANKYVFIHSCGKVDSLFDDLANIGLNCFNPFQPEVMDVYELMNDYKGRLAFHGGLSTQHTLPHGTAEDVRNETLKLLDAGRHGGYIFAPAHSVESDVSLENMLAFIETVKNQDGYQAKECEPEGCKVA